MSNEGTIDIQTTAGTPASLTAVSLEEVTAAEQPAAVLLPQETAPEAQPETAPEKQPTFEALLNQLEQLIGYSFQNRTLLRRALTHRSYATNKLTRVRRTMRRWNSSVTQSLNSSSARGC